MSGEKEREKKNKRIGLITSAGIHILLLLLFLFSMAWRAPDPPLPEFGIELNFGVDNQGTGEIQPETPTASEAETTSEQDVQPETEEAEVKEQVKETTQEVIASNQESVVPVKEEKKEEKKKEPEKPKEVEKPKAVYKADDTKKEDKQANNKASDQPVSQGDDANAKGDKGDPKGTLDSKALYGKAGGGAGGDGMVLSMSGWAWADNPKIPTLPDNEDGRIVFEIECDEEGEIVGIKTLERGLSIRAEQILLSEIRKNSLIRTSGGQTPERSKGKVVFILKTR